MRGLPHQLASQRGVAMVEATIGTVLLLLAALITIQLVLVFHGALAGHSAATKAARKYALTGRFSDALGTFNREAGTTLQGIHMTLNCENQTQRAKCTVDVDVPTVIPGAGLFTGSGLAGPISFLKEGYYPIGLGSTD